MTLKYKVRTKHTKEVLSDFVKFSFRVRHPHTTLQLCVFGSGLIIIGVVAARGTMAMWICLALGLLICIYAFMRHRIGVSKLAKNDPAYMNDWDIQAEFWDGEFRIQNGSEQEKIVKRYQEIEAVYEDEKNYYIGVAGDDLYVLPRKDFVDGLQEEFQKFITAKTKKEIRFIPMKMRNKMKLTYAKMKMMDEAHDAMIAEKKKNKKK